MAGEDLSVLRYRVTASVALITVIKKRRNPPHCLNDKISPLSALLLHLKGLLLQLESGSGIRSRLVSTLAAFQLKRIVKHFM